MYMFTLISSVPWISMLRKQLPINVSKTDEEKPRSNFARQWIGEISESNMKQHLSIQFHQQGLYVGCFKDPEIGDLQCEIPGKP